MVSFQEPFLTCDNCGHAFSDAATYQLAGVTLKKVASQAPEITSDTVAEVRKDLRVSRKLLEIALEAADKQTAAWETSRKQMSEPVQNVWRTIAGDPRVPAKLLLARRNVWLAFIDRLSTSSSVGPTSLPGAATDVVAATAVAIFAAPLAAGFIGGVPGSIVRAPVAKRSTSSAGHSQVLAQYVVACRSAHHPECRDSETLASLCTEWLKAIQPVSSMVQARDCLEEFAGSDAVLGDWRKRYEVAQKELSRVSDRVAARRDSVRNALSHVPEHPRAHLRLASRLVDTLEINDVLDLYHRSSGREPEIRFAILFAEKLQERVTLPN